MAGEGGLHADLGGLEVADLAHHDDVRVLAQEAAKGGREVEADVVVHLHLVDPEEVELDDTIVATPRVITFDQSEDASA